ncbi:sialate O-acetylesterase [Lactonifactor sp. BIOML-A3]|uniref:sialate O-acetylesterase n=1 Tax=unclassified Lactonifactor TaxID=2636670 RepID=UPI0012B144C1|nr:MULTISPECIES: sialate O-acetylesterase [unclassified Lactonifactor]MSA01003.1 sialate O-acetylesterase [Lactonifactor sp. BIOML-A5]MSA07797.1 sialate O-acetylesterase [Lactonifactor sp. BIOML-A4]MSA11993.1 sialate O-acetylesterase [Lactonifactor sp. BIOML-A3]MSA16433.1 sialate O-acetylesterase [Lactonifactor sp. BIOML-A2]MSA37037.1 sialate O-acetylesterase [Lactonifactor sp. BIOML-A1]
MTKSILMIGQSNMAGRGFLNDVPTICNERIQMLRNGRWQMMAEPINYDRPTAGVGLAGSFAAMWCMENEDDNIGLIPCAEGGSALDDWAVDKTLYKHAVCQARFAMQDSELLGILWHQGENDGFGGNYQTYYEKLQVLVNQLRKDLHAEKVPFVIGALGDYLGKSGFGLNCTEYEMVNQELFRFAKEQKHTYFVTAAGLTSNPDGIHLNAVSQRKFGIRYYEAFSKKKHIITPLENETEILDACINRPHTKGEELYLQMLNFSFDKITYEEFVCPPA